MKRITCYLDFISPYAHLAFEHLPQALDVLFLPTQAVGKSNEHIRFPGTLTLSAQQIKDLLEQQFVGCRGQGTQRILIPSAGFKYTWNSAGTCDSRISDVRLVDANGTLVYKGGIDSIPSSSTADIPKANKSDLHPKLSRCL